MLLSILVSFILAKKYTGKTYGVLMAVTLIGMSICSVGLPISGPPNPRYKELSYPVPLSFPAYALEPVEWKQIYNIHEGTIEAPFQWYQFYFLTFRIVEFGPESRHVYVLVDYIILLNSFVLFINIVGAIFGYWISKTTFLEKLLKKG